MLADERRPELSATRSELLARRSQIGLALQGRGLLEEKRDALKREFVRLGASVLEAMGSLEERCAQGRRELDDAVALDGPDVVGSASLAATGGGGGGLFARDVAGGSIVEGGWGAVGAAIAATTRRVNALEIVVIPRLEAERDAIAMVLEEREREVRVRLLRARPGRDATEAG